MLGNVEMYPVRVSEQLADATEVLSSLDTLSWMENSRHWGNVRGSVPKQGSGAELLVRVCRAKPPEAELFAV